MKGGAAPPGGGGRFIGTAPNPRSRAFRARPGYASWHTSRSPGAARGGALKGGAGGALAGAAIGAIAGDAGKGAAIGATSLGLTGGVRSRRAMKAAGGTSESAVAAYQQQFATWNRNFMAAMEAKGYTVR